MRRLLGILIVLGLLAGQSVSVSAAVCQHHSLREHAMARQSHDRRIAAAALNEETAASVQSKKGATSAGPSSTLSALADLLPVPALRFPLPDLQPIPHPLTDAAELIGISTMPLLRPPLA